MSFETTIFEATYNNISWSRCQLKIGRNIIERCTVAGIEQDRQNTENGQYNMIGAQVRLLLSDEPESGIVIGQTVELKQYGRDDWINLRVGGKFTQGGVTRLSMEAVNE